MRAYLDHNATSPLRPGVKRAMLAAMDAQGNASSIHREGRAARKNLSEAREKLGFWLGCLPEMITFTCGGTEANNMALRGVEVERILVSAIEHPSVLAAARANGKPVEVIPVDGKGRVNLPAFEMMLNGPKALVSVMLANNETGVIQPTAEIAALAHKAGAVLHVDAVQAIGKIKVNFGLLGADMLTIAAHKIGGPTGVGALIIRDGLVVEPLLVGGGQELRRRAGTENLVHIAGFAALADEPLLDTYELNDKLEAALTDTTIFSNGVERLPNTTYFAATGMNAESLLMNFDLDGVAVSSGSACSSGKVASSHVLAAMGVDPALAKSAIRVSLGWNTTAEEIEKFISSWRKISQRLHSKAA
ncbi:MAG: cysteine desulfurase [Alphaproteobacteria bacterium]|nr:cysteine desulfurase [Alphaproteobacteria bacterium]